MPVIGVAGAPAVGYPFDQINYATFMQDRRQRMSDAHETAASPGPATETGPETGTARRERGAVTIWSALREDILDLRLDPGSALDEVGIARQFGLSRTPVREALFMLSGEGLVHLLPNRSSIVAPLTLANLNDYFDTLLILTRAVMVSAALRCGADDAVVLRDRLAAFRAAVDGGDRMTIVHRQLAFLNAFVDVGRNLFLAKFYPDCLDYGRRTMLLYYYPHVRSDELRHVADGHEALIRAVESGDGDGCQRLVGEHIARVVAVIQASLSPVFADRVDLSTADLPRIHLP